MSENQSPFNALPFVVIGLCVTMAGLELVFSAGAHGLAGGAQGVTWRFGAIADYAFAPTVIEAMTVRSDFGLDVIRRFVTYPFIHATFMDAMFGIVLTLALGKFVGDAFGNFATVLLFMASAVFGALVFGFLLDGPIPLVGAFPPAYGLIGGYTYLIWLHLGQSGESQLAAFRLIGFLMGLQLVFGLIGGGPPTWIAELAGFVAGFALAPLLAPGGWRAFVARMRDR